MNLNDTHGVTEARAPRYLCNKCGATPHVPRHQRPDGKPCDYLAVFIAAGVPAVDTTERVKAIAQRRELWEPGVGSVHMTADELLAFGEECAAGVTLLSEGQQCGS